MKWYRASYQGEHAEIHAVTIFEAWRTAIKRFAVPTNKRHLLYVTSCSGSPQTVNEESPREPS